MGDKDVRSIGRLRYVEPTNFFEYREGNYADSINFPYEDYCMAVDLNIRITDRYSCGFGLQTGEYRDISFSSDRGTLSFLGGSKYDSSGNTYLTTNYTDISMTSPETNTSECLGIESINITYSSWMYPQVVIKFVDVRGATVMMPNENGYYNPQDMGAASTLYKALFTFPYPMFTLKVKGFYGRGVTYRLAVEKTSLEFDSETGNFIITASFIGYMFGIYADIPMTFLAVAPYMAGGREYWAQKVQEGVFCFRDTSGFPKAPMCTIPELRYKLAAAATSEEAVSAAQEGAEMVANYDDEINKLQDIVTNIPLADWEEIDSANCYIKIFDERINSYDIRISVSGYVSNVSGYDYTYGTTYLNYFPDLVNIAQYRSRIDGIEYIATGDSDKTYTYKNNQWNDYNYKKYVLPYPEVINYIEKERKKKNNFFVYIIPKSEGEYSKQYGIEKITDRLETLQQEKIEAQEKYQNLKDTAIESAIGFKPSIRNIYNLVFAHMETFIHTFYEMTRNIKDQLDGTTEKALRDKSHYNIGDDKTDTERSTTKNTNSENVVTEARGKYLPPFAAFYESVKDISGETRSQLYWPEKLTNGNDLEEVNYVISLLNASELYSETSLKVDDLIKEMNERTIEPSTTIVAGDAPSPSVKDFIPLTTYDFIHKDEMRNPYADIKDKIYQGESDIEGEILGLFALRAFYYLCTNDSDGRREGKSFGVLEAINLFKAVGDRYSNTFSKFVQKYADNINEREERSNFINAILSPFEDNITNVWRRKDAPNLNLNLFSEGSDKRIFYRYHSGFTYSNDEIRTNGSASGYVISSLGNNGLPTENSYTAEPGKVYQMFPLRVSNFRSLAKAYAMEKGQSTNGIGQPALLNNPDFIAIDNINGIYGNEENKNSTFYLYETRNYIKNLFANIESEISEADKAISKQTGVATNRGTDEYGKVKRENRTLRNYENNIKNFRGTAYMTGSIVDENNIYVTYSLIQTAIMNGNSDTLKNYYIKYPTITDKQMQKSLFSDTIYLIQKDIKAKAFLFLQAIPIYGDGNNGGIESNNENGLAMKVRLLREGSYYWRQDNPDIINFMNDEVEYKIPGLQQTFMRSCPGSQNYMAVLSMLTVKDKNKDYIEWISPVGTTPSRRKILKKYFEEWAESTDDTYGFAANEPRLRNERLYEANISTIQQTEGVDSSRVYSRGLNIKDLVTATLNGTRRQTEDAKEAQKLQEFLQDLFFRVCTTMDLYSGLISGNDGRVEFNCKEIAMNKAFQGFIEELHNIYGQTAKEIRQNPQAYQAKVAANELSNPFKNTDLRLSTYMTLKSLYDKWLCAPYNGPYKTWSLELSQSDPSKSGGSDFSNFMYVDSFYHDIGWKLVANVTKVSEWLSSCLPTSNVGTTEGEFKYTGKSVYEFLTQVAQDVGAVLHAFPQRFGMMTSEQLVDMFTPIPINADWDEDSSSFVFMYSYKPSEHLGDEETSNTDMNGYAPVGDSFNLTNEELMGLIMGDNGYTVPAFGVTFAKQNQTIFKNVRLTTENAGVTEASIAATFNIAAKGSESPRESVLYGQDLYRVYSQYAYDCGVDMMGNMQIMPLMYFQLNNIPLWKGAYMIIKVNHNITAGNIVTHFDGVRQNRNAIPMADGAVITSKNPGDETIGGDNRPTESINGDGFVLRDDSVNNIISNPVITISDPIDFNERNVTPQKPIICLTPAHGPNTQKALEWSWSADLVQKIKERLSEYTFSDGTSYSENIQICNKNGNHTGRNGYSSTEVKNLINKYGSNQVISVVPHWNGGHGQYHMVMVNKLSASTRNDSWALAECMRTEMENVRTNSGSYDKMPLGMMKYPSRISLLGADNTDWAPQQACACILTENWFADYPVNCNWSTEGFDYPNADGRMPSGRGWLVHQGMDILAEAHARGIKRYIDSLS